MIIKQYNIFLCIRLDEILRSGHGEILQLRARCRRVCASYVGVEGECDVLVVASGGEGDLGQSEVILGSGQRGVEHQHIALQREENGERERVDESWIQPKALYQRRTYPLTTISEQIS